MIFLSKCQSCNHKLIMLGKKRFNTYSCSKCTPKDSSIRDDINETYKYEWIRI